MKVREKMFAVETILMAAFVLVGSITLIVIGYSQGVQKAEQRQNKINEEVIANLVVTIVKIEASYKDQRVSHKTYLVDVTAALHVLVPNQALRNALLNEERKRQGVTNPFSDDLAGRRVAVQNVIPFKRRTPEESPTMQEKVSLQDMVLGRGRWGTEKRTPNKQPVVETAAPTSSPTPQTETTSLPAANGYAETLHRVMTSSGKSHEKMVVQQPSTEEEVSNV